ncbi:MAG: nucleoside/nucleotide kinase family protein [Alkalibacterium sp.]|uniref:nucleoside/nucleotide kinase family protein n=1 Tax=Alkalibacterium sp. TaxID=1872447 RepID=UPI003970EF4B
MKLNVNGFIIEANYTEQEIHSVFLPLLNELTERRRRKGERLIVFLAAPPGTGKTTLSLYLEKLYSEHFSSFSFQSISIDGFHHRRDYLLSHYMTEDDDRILLNDIKGSPETFDVDGLKMALQTLENEPVLWPLYDRNTHDVSESKVKVDADIILIEGNWLLLNEAAWQELADYSDYSIFIHTDETLLKARLIERKMRGGVSWEEAGRFYEQSDSKNVKRVLENHHDPDLTLYLNNKKEIVKG